MTLRIEAATREFVVEYREQTVRRLPLKGLIGEQLPWNVYLEQIALEARTQSIAGRPFGQQLRLPLENI